MALINVNNGTSGYLRTDSVDNMYLQINWERTSINTETMKATFTCSGFLYCPSWVGYRVYGNDYVYVNGTLVYSNYPGRGTGTYSDPKYAYCSIDIPSMSDKIAYYDLGSLAGNWVYGVAHVFSNHTFEVDISDSGSNSFTISASLVGYGNRYWTIPNTRIYASTADVFSKLYYRDNNTWNDTARIWHRENGVWIKRKLFHKENGSWVKK